LCPAPGCIGPGGGREDDNEALYNQGEPGADVTKMSPIVTISRQRKSLSRKE